MEGGILGKTRQYVRALYQCGYFHPGPPAGLFDSLSASRAGAESQRQAVTRQADPAADEVEPAYFAKPASSTRLDGQNGPP